MTIECTVENNEWQNLCSKSLSSSPLHSFLRFFFFFFFLTILNPIEESFSAWRWKVFDHWPHEILSLLDAMDGSCRESLLKRRIKHAECFYPRCIARDDKYEEDEKMWPNADRIYYNRIFIFFPLLFCFIFIHMEPKAKHSDFFYLTMAAILKWIHVIIE